jgi:hypothetical protein
MGQPRQVAEELAPETFEKYPGIHCSQMEAPNCEYEPETQIEHTVKFVAPCMVEYVPP